VDEECDEKQHLTLSIDGSRDAFQSSTPAPEGDQAANAHTVKVPATEMHLSSWLNLFWKPSRLVLIKLPVQKIVSSQP
jgi:hypothetical protein